MSLLGREPVFEVVVSTDTEGKTKCTSSILDPTAPAALIVDGLMKCAGVLAEQAEQVATQSGLVIAMDPMTGEMRVTPK